MIRGTTPTHIFDLPFDTSLIQDLRICYSQNDGEVLCKCKDDCTLEGNTISVKLSQEETLSFKCDSYVKIQIRILTLGGEVVSNYPLMVSVCQCLNEEVLS